MAGFEKGNTCGGRKKGSLNRLSSKRNLIWTLIIYELKDEIIEVLREEIEENPKSAIKLMISISNLFKTRGSPKEIEAEFISEYLGISIDLIKKNAKHKL